MNNRETKIFDFFRSEGFTVLRSGWPDFLVINENGGFCVEVKSGTQVLEPNQCIMREALERLGLPVYVMTVSPSNLNVSKLALTERGPEVDMVEVGIKAVKQRLEELNVEVRRLEDLLRECSVVIDGRSFEILTFAPPKP